jgi:hypothetical protein
VSEGQGTTETGRGTKETRKSDGQYGWIPHSEACLSVLGLRRIIVPIPCFFLLYSYCVVLYIHTYSTYSLYRQLLSAMNQQGTHEWRAAVVPHTTNIAQYLLPHLSNSGSEVPKYERYGFATGPFSVWQGWSLIYPHYSFVRSSPAQYAAAHAHLCTYAQPHFRNIHPCIITAHPSALMAHTLPFPLPPFNYTSTKESYSKQQSAFAYSSTTSASKVALLDLSSKSVRNSHAHRRLDFQSPRAIRSSRPVIARLVSLASRVSQPRVNSITERSPTLDRR